MIELTNIFGIRCLDYADNQLWNNEAFTMFVLDNHQQLNNLYKQFQINDGYVFDYQILINKINPVQLLDQQADNKWILKNKSKEFKNINEFDTFYKQSIRPLKKCTRYGDDFETSDIDYILLAIEHHNYNVVYHITDELFADKVFASSLLENLMALKQNDITVPYIVFEYIYSKLPSSNYQPE